MTEFQVNKGKLSAALKISKKIKDSGYQVLFAGGFVRDLITNTNLETSETDIDIVTDATVEELTRILKVAHCVGKRFGVVIAAQDRHHFEVTTFREDGEYIDGRRPLEVYKGDIYSDSKRRDFTINGLYFDPFTKEIIDLVNGKKDLENKILRCIGDPRTRIEEDKLRALRCIRFSATLGFKVAKSTQEVISNTCLFPSVSKERVLQEFIKADSRNGFLQFIKKLRYTEMYRDIFKEHKCIISKKSEQFINENYSKLPLPIKIATIFPDTSIYEIANLLFIQNRDLDLIEMYLAIKQSILKRSSVFRIMQNIKNINYEVALSLAIWSIGLYDKNLADKYESLMLKNKDAIQDFIKNKRPISGYDICLLGIPPGPIYRKITDIAWKLRIEKNYSKEQILKAIYETL
ncbi:MAG: CCA tRNA nucleotidyltransferase [Chlamydiia bacterium]|nr:CCA tRNA nucleotidyltransferase [Chlamydiia bacterium]